MIPVSRFTGKPKWRITAIESISYLVDIVTSLVGNLSAISFFRDHTMKIAFGITV